VRRVARIGGEIRGARSGSAGRPPSPSTVGKRSWRWRLESARLVSGVERPQPPFVGRKEFARRCTANAKLRRPGVVTPLRSAVPGRRWPMPSESRASQGRRLPGSLQMGKQGSLAPTGTTHNGNQAWFPVQIVPEIHCRVNFNLTLGSIRLVRGG
jgi:hypothetical protein